MTEQHPFAFRKLEASDIDFISNSWLKSFYGEQPDLVGPRLRRAFKQDFFAIHQPVVNHLLTTAKVIAVAHDKDDPQLIQGWIVADQRADCEVVVHYCYVKFAFRRLGLGKALVTEALRQLGRDSLPDTVFATHKCLSFYALQDVFLKQPKPIFLRFDPYSVICR